MSEQPIDDELTTLRAQNEQLKWQILLYQKRNKRSWVMFLI